MGRVVPKLEVGNFQQIGGHRDMEATCGGWGARICVWEMGGCNVFGLFGWFLHGVYCRPTSNARNWKTSQRPTLTNAWPWTKFGRQAKAMGPQAAMRTAAGWKVVGWSSTPPRTKPSRWPSSASRRALLSMETSPRFCWWFFGTRNDMRSIVSSSCGILILEPSPLRVWTLSNG